MIQTLTLQHRLTKHFGIITTCFFIFLNCYGQTNSALVPKTNIPTSPEAALLGRFGEIPVSFHTGTANISVPLYTIKEGNIEVPLTLSYHSSGIKVADEATWVGLGWDLSPGGAIIQEVRGKPDDEDNNLDMNIFPAAYATFKSRLGPIESGAYYSAFQTGHNLKQPTGPDYPSPDPLDDPANILFKLQQGYGQPDVYHYSFNGYAGKFYIHPETQKIVLMDKKEMVYFEKMGASWKATTLDGTVFLFQAKETSHAQILTDITGFTYKLSKIELLNGRSVDFTYTDEKSISEVYRESLVFDEPPFGKGSYIRDYTVNHKKTLMAITTSDAVINFNLEDRDDILHNNSKSVKRLKSIDVKSVEKNKKIKTFEFGYSYFSYNLAGAPADSNGGLEPYTAAHLEAYGKRLRLDSLKEIGYDGNEAALTTKPAYKFEYNVNTTMPLKNSFAVDFWGYYNGRQNTRLIPDLRYFEYEHDTRYLDVFPLIFPYVGANRYPDNSVADVNMLQKITYPTGGFTEFEYEPNSFTNQFIPDQSKLPLVHKSIHLADKNDRGNIMHGTFKLSKGVTISFQNSITASNINRAPWSYKDMQDCYIRFAKVKMVNGSPVVTIIKQWDLSTVLNADFTKNQGKQWAEKIWVEYDPHPSLSYLVDVYMPEHLNYEANYYHNAGVTSWFSYSDDNGFDATTSNGCGLRIKSVKNYSARGSLTSYKSVTYYEGKLLDKFEPLQTIFSVYNRREDVNTWSMFRKRTWMSSGDLAGGGGTPVGYGKVEETDLAADGSADNGKNVYFYFNEENQRRKGYPGSPFLKNGLLIRQEVFDKMQNKLLETENMYTNLIPFSCYSGIIITNHTFGNSDWVDDRLNNNNPYVPFFKYKFSYGIYPLIAEWNKLQRVITKQYSGNNAIIKTESYTYNQEGSVSTITKSNSKGQPLVTKYFYPTDNMIHPYIDGYMTRVHNTGKPVITEQYNGTKLLYKRRTFYGTYAGVPTLMPQYEFEQHGTFSEEKKVTMNAYDGKGNILQYTEENNIPVSFIWNTDKTLPTAKCENASHLEIAYAGFEGGSFEGNWNFAGIPITDSNALTGSKVYDLSAGNITKSDLTLAKTYIVTCWSKDGKQDVNNLTPIMTVANTNGWKFYKYKITKASGITIKGTGVIDELRLYPLDAQMTTYTYVPLVGLTAQCTINNDLLYYEYDEFGRLKLVRDQNKNIIKKYAYQFAD